MQLVYVEAITIVITKAIVNAIDIAIVLESSCSP